MRLNEIVAWYQKKIGTNDKQRWEQTVEQRIFSGCSSYPLRNAKLKTGLIDVDLVRGSTFPKAKPKQTLITVLYLAVVRLLFLPLYAKWWVNQTSPKIFAVLLLLYLLQMVSWAIYSYKLNRINAETEHIVHISEILIPMALSLFLSVIHSQIVATSNNGLDKKRRKRLSPTKNKKREKFKRRRKSLRSRTSDLLKMASNNATTKPHSNIVELENTLPSDRNPTKSTTRSDKSKLNVNTPPDEACVSRKVTGANTNSVIVSTNSSVRKRISRNVVWDSPIKTNLPSSDTHTTENRDNEIEHSGGNVGVDVDHGENAATPIEDDGFESFNGKSSSGEENNANQNPVSKDEAVVNDVNVPSKISSSVAETDSQIADSPNRFFASKLVIKPESTDTDGESDEGGTLSSPSLPFAETATSATEWMGITTNSEDCSYSSEIDPSESDNDLESEDGAVILNATCGSSDRISCTIWDGREIKKAEMSVLDISSAIIERVESMPETCDYIYIGVVLSLLLSLLPALCRLREATFEAGNSTDINFLDMPVILLEKASFSVIAIMKLAFGDQLWERTISIVSFAQRLILTFLFFFLLTVAEKTFKQRFLYAKLFSHLTSSRRARKSNIPHFRLNKVRNIKTWLSVRSYLKRRGPQRSVDMIVSAAFMITLLLVAFLSVEWLKDSVHIHTQLNLEALMWSFALGVFLLRFMTLGQKINKKYRSVSVLITEQINLYVQIEQKPHKKEELMVSNSVLKLAADLLKELESPFKISGLSANPYLYTTIKVVIMSALSGVLSEMLGFKLKLHKIKIK